MAVAEAFPQLKGQQYINLTTFRKSGEAVATPVWFAVDGDRLFIVTQADSGKVKRIRNNPRVTLVASDARGNVKPDAPTLRGEASVHSAAEGVRADKALKAKYGFMYSAFALMWRVRGITPVYLEVKEG